MKLKILLATFFAFCFLFHSETNAQWESSIDSIIPIDHRAYAIKIAKDQSIWIISKNAAGHYLNKYIHHTHRSADGGETWTHSVLSDAPSLAGWDISPIDSLTAYIALHTAGLYKTIDGGRSWAKVQAFPYPAMFVHFFNAEEGWVFNSRARATSDTDSIVSISHSVTNDGGETWTYIGGDDWNQPEGTSLPEKDSSEFVGVWKSTNSSYDYTERSIVIGMAHGTYWLSTDKGYNWERHNTPLSELDLVTNSITVKDRETIMVAGNHFTSTFTAKGYPTGRSTVSFATQDGGGTWNEGSPGLFTSSLQYIPGSDSIFIMTGHYEKFNGTQGTAITYDFGKNWEIIDNNRLIAIDFLDKKNGVGVCCNFGLWADANGQVFKWNFPLPELSKEAPSWYIWLIITLVCLAAFIIYRYWIRKKLHKKEIAEQKISKLEQSALQAQINPHFIFNCLGAIRDLVKNNDKELANKYLVHFGELTRGILRASSEDKISLEDDITLLKNYLELEKMRLSDRIDYSIIIDKNIDLFDLMVPAMLMQPIIENSIIHGLAEQSERGKIKVKYHLQDDCLMITMEDNVKGIYLSEKQQPYKKEWLKFVGISNIEKRLNLNHAYNEIKIEALKSESGQIIGTKVILNILLS